MNILKNRVIYVVESLTVGGVSRVIEESVNRLQGLYEFQVVVLGGNITGINDDFKKYIRVFNIEPSFNYRLLDYFKDIIIQSTVKKWYAEVIDYIANQKPDIIHFHTLPRLLPIGTAVKSKINTCLVYTDHLVRLPLHSYKWHQKTALGIIYRTIYNKYNLIYVSNSVEYIANKFHFCARKQKCILINNGVDVELFSKKIHQDKHSIVVVYVARISPVKGHLDLIAAWKNILPIDAELWLIGPNEMEEKINQDLLKNTNIKILGSRTDIKSLLEQADLAVFPSYNEGLPIALLEKMAMQLPVIVSNIPELTNIVEDNIDSLVFELGNGAQLSDKIRQLINQPELRYRLGTAAREKVKKHYSIESSVQNTNLFYKTLLKL